MGKDGRKAIEAQIAASLQRLDPQTLGRLAAQGRTAVDAFARGQAEQRSPSAQQRKLVERHEKTMRKYRERIDRLRARAMGFGAGAAGLAVVAVASVPVAGPGVATAAAAGGAAASGWVSRRSVLKRRRLIATPPVLPPIPLVIPVLPPGTPGAEESARLAFVRRRLEEIVPAIRAMHPVAAEELLAADREAGPALAMTVERLAVLAQIEATMPGTAAAQAASEGAAEVRRRLAGGVESYERLIAAGATMLAAPDLSRSSEAVLAPAVDALIAYAAGLSRSADALDR